MLSCPRLLLPFGSDGSLYRRLGSTLGRIPRETLPSNRSRVEGVLSYHHESTQIIRVGSLRRCRNLSLKVLCSLLSNGGLSVLVLAIDDFIFSLASCTEEPFCVAGRSLYFRYTFYFQDSSVGEHSSDFLKVCGITALETVETEPS
ncbi:hypothetical protein Tco_1194169 [Tanacetum coccineum]